MPPSVHAVFAALSCCEMFRPGREKKGVAPGPAVLSSAAAPSAGVAPAAGGTPSAPLPHGVRRRIARANNEASAANALRRQLNCTRVEPLCSAAEEGRLNEVQELLKRNNIHPAWSRDLEVAGNKDQTPLFLAMRNGHDEIVAALLDDPRVQFKPSEEDYGRLHECLVNLIQGMEPDQPNRSGMLETLLQHPKIDPNWKDANGQTLLHLAAKEGRFKEIVLLLDKTNRPDLPAVDPDVADKDGYTPLHFAASGGNPKLVRWLLRADARTRQANDLSTPLSIAVKSNRPDIVAELIETVDVKAIDTSDEQGDNLLMHAARLNNPELVKLLLDNGADVNAMNGKNWRTALLEAAEVGNPVLVNMLLENGADLWADDLKGQNALIIAVRNSHAELAELLVERMRKIHATAIDNADEMRLTALMHATRANDPALVNMLLDKGASLDPVDFGGRKALLIAGDDGNVGMVELLLDRMQATDPRAVDTRDADGETLLMYAARANNAALLNTLLEKGADIDAVNHQGKNALLVAASQGNTEAVALLLERMQATNANAIEMADAAGDTLLMHIAAAGNRTLVDTLLEKGANLMAVNNLGQHALMSAASRRNTEIAELLLDRMLAIDVNIIDIPDAFGDTPLIHATRANDVALVNTLLNKGANVYARNAMGKHALLVAATEGLTELAELLLDRMQATDPRAVDAVNGLGDTLLIHAARVNNATMLYMLLDKGADLTALNEMEQNALLVAVLHEHADIAETLVERMQAIDASAINAPTDARGTTLLMHAASLGNTTMLNMLLNKGADPMAVNEMGQNALLIAVDHGHAEAVEWLLERMRTINGNVINMADAQGNTPLMYAARAYNAPLLKKLMAKGADTKAVNHADENAFAIASMDWRRWSRSADGTSLEGAATRSLIASLQLIKLRPEEKFKFQYQTSDLESRFLEEDKFALKSLHAEATRNVVFNIAKLVAGYLERGEGDNLLTKEEMVHHVNGHQQSHRDRYPILRKDFRDFSELSAFLNKPESECDENYHVQLLAVLWFITDNAGKKAPGSVREIDALYYEVMTATKDHLRNPMPIPERSEKFGNSGKVTSPTFGIEEFQPYVRDADYVSVNPNSSNPIVRSFINKRIPYISGLSGMTNLGCDLFEVLDIHPLDPELGKPYAEALAAFIVGSGMHTYPEVYKALNLYLKLLEARRRIREADSAAGALSTEAPGRAGIAIADPRATPRGSVAG